MGEIYSFPADADSIGRLCDDVYRELASIDPAKAAEIANLLEGAFRAVHGALRQHQSVTFPWAEKLSDAELEQFNTWLSHLLNDVRSDTVSALMPIIWNLCKTL